MKNLFIARTPYNLVLASGLAYLNPKNEKNILILIKDFEGEISENINNINEIFDEITTFNYHKKNKYRIIDKNELKIKNYILLLMKYNYFKNIYVFNDSNLLEQKICENAFFYGFKVSYIEDGTAAYNEGIKINHGFLSNLKWKFKSNFIYRINNSERIKILGTSKHIKDIYVTYPEFTVKELKNKNVYELDNQVLSYGIELLYNNIINKLPYIKNTVIILLELEESLKNKREIYIRCIEEIVVYCIKYKIKFLLKYHPREKEEYIKINISKEVIIEKSIPIEVIFRKLKEKNILVTVNSTAVLTANKILNDESLEVISLMNIINIIDYKLLEMFEKMNVKIVDRMEQINLIIQNTF